jgi:hypothetical protein
MSILKRNVRRHPWLAVLIGVSSVATLSIGAGLFYYLRAGLGKRDASLIPDSVEGRIDKVVEALNQKFGKRWVNRGVSALQAGLSVVLPTPLIGLVEVVHRVEHLAEQNGWKSHEKLSHAAEMTA